MEEVQRALISPVKTYLKLQSGGKQSTMLGF